MSVIADLIRAGADEADFGDLRNFLSFAGIDDEHSSDLARAVYGESWGWS